MARLRDPVEGCPWDREQDFGTIAPYTIEEAYEVADAIDRDDLEGLREELGDLLLQVVFHAQMAREISAFDFGDVVAGICTKMIRRHPHVFGGETIADAAAQRMAWEEHKARERAGNGNLREGGSVSVLDGVGHALPALMRAEKLGKRAGQVGFDWEDLGGVAAKVREELDEVMATAAASEAARRQEEVGDLLFSVVNLSRHLQVDPEEALRSATRKFEIRFRAVEAAVRDSGRSWNQFTPGELDALWQAAKRDTSSAP